MSGTSLYIHIPFCLKKCGYCDFFSRESVSVPDAYVHAILNEVSLHSLENNILFDTVYVGGGTPSLLSASQIEELFCGLKPFLVPEPLEITFEMNPETLTEEKLCALESSGVDRISLGIQSLDDKALSGCGRRCTAEKARKALRTVASFWKKKLSLDAIAGLPYERSLGNEEKFLASLEEILSYKPSHVSLYSLSLEEGTPLYSRFKNEDYDFDSADGQWLKGRDFLFKNGFVQYEVSNFALPGFEAVHNSRYWKQADYAGAGSGATGTFYGKKLRWTNTEDVDSYIAFWNLPDEERRKAYKAGKAPRTEEHLKEDELSEEFLMMGLRTINGVSEADFRERYGKDLALLLNESRIWKQFVSEGKAVYKDGRASLTADGLLFLNTLLLDLF